MADLEESILEGDPRERLAVPVTTNAKLECSRFCLADCGIYGDAQEMVLIGTAMVAGSVASGEFSKENPEIQTESATKLPELVLTCKGPRKKYWVAGGLVCRKSAKIDTA